MLENPTDENVVRWGNDGDSFVVLEVRGGTDHGSMMAGADRRPERKIHKAHSAQTLQAQQLRQFCATAQQIRFPQSSTQQRRERAVAVRTWGRCSLAYVVVLSPLWEGRQRFWAPADT